MESLFVYGTLYDPQIQMQLIGRTVESQPDTLHGYGRNFDLLPPYPVAMPQENGTIEGYVLQITSEELAFFDIYETNAYQRSCVQLASGLETWVYLGNPTYFTPNP